MIIEGVLDIIILSVLGLFAIVGLFFLGKMVVESILITRFGFVKVKLFTRNYRIKDLLVKPKEGRVKINNVEQPFNDSPGFIYFNSNHPVAFYKEGDIGQINIENTNKTNVDPSLFDRLAVSLFETGKLYGMRKTQFQDVINVLMIVLLIIVVIGFGYTAYKLSVLDQILEKVAKLG